MISAANLAGRLSITGVALAAASVVVLLAAPAGYRLGLLSLRVALVRMVPGGVVAAAVALVVSVAAVVLARIGGRPQSVAWVGFVASVLVVAFPAFEIVRARMVPAIHDITTDTEDVPPFVALAPQRSAAPNGGDYEGKDVARLQHEAYPDVESLRSNRSPADAFELARRVVQQSGWQIAAAEPAEGRIEATATTSLFGFKDDIVVRIRPEGQGSRIDIRSMSRLGRSDIGTNAARVRGFLERLRAEGA